MDKISLTAIINDFLIKLGFNDQRVGLVAEKITQEIFDNTFIELLEPSNLENLKLSLASKDSAMVHRIINSIDADILNEEVKIQTNKVISDILSQITQRLDQSDLPKFGKLISQITTSLNYTQFTIEKTPEETLGIFASKIN